MLVAYVFIMVTSRNPAAHGDGVEPIAVIGFSMRFPDEATSPEGLWNILREGRNVMTEVPPERFNIDGFYHPDAMRPDTVRYSHEEDV